jgi:lipopolysaccharide biosynthesis glycosyltransferase
VTSHNKQAVVCCVTRNWLPAAAVTLLSCAAAGKVDGADLIILTLGAEPVDETTLARFNAKHGLSIKMQPVESVGQDRADLSRFGLGALLRLTLDRNLAPSYERVLYLDADVLAVDDLRPLLASRLNGKTLAAVPDLGIVTSIREKVAAHRAELDLADGQLYFNSGVLLLDWPATLSRDALGRTRAMLTTRPRWRAPDQDALNLALENEWQPIDYRWNVTGLLQEGNVVTPAICHFTASEKPWMSRRFLWHRRFHTTYVSSLAGTGWETFTEPRTPYGLLRATGEAVRKSFHHQRRAAIAAAVAGTRFEAN